MSGFAGTLDGRQVVAGFWLRGLAMTLVTALGAQVSMRLPFTPVPLTGQVFGVLLSGLVLTPAGAFAAQVAYLAGAALGLPWLAGGTAWIGGLVTAGYLAGFPLAAWVVGRLRPWIGPGWACVGGVAAIHLPGGAWRWTVTGWPLPEAMVLGSLPFWPGDVLKGMLAILAAARWAPPPERGWE